MKIKDLKAGDYFKVTEDAKIVYIMGGPNGWTYKKNYDRSTKTYGCVKANDVNSEKFFKADKEVFVNFEY